MKTLRKLNPSKTNCRDCYLRKSCFRQQRIFLVDSGNDVMQLKQHVVKVIEGKVK